MACAELGASCLAISCGATPCIVGPDLFLPKKCKSGLLTNYKRRTYLLPGRQKNITNDALLQPILDCHYAQNCCVLYYRNEMQTLLVLVPLSTPPYDKSWLHDRYLRLFREWVRCLLLPTKDQRHASDNKYRGRYYYTEGPHQPYTN